MKTEILARIIFPITFVVLAVCSIFAPARAVGFAMTWTLRLLEILDERGKSL